MKIKSLLLGSAAALVAATTAQAADAIIVEPEPMEYVKVCDMYGAGFFYIPGTETCLRISGHVRVEYRSFHYHEDAFNTISNHRWRARGQFTLDARNETEYGTLGSNITVRAGWVTGNQGTLIGTEVRHDWYSLYGDGPSEAIRPLQATINLAGFRTGYDANGGGVWNRYGGYGYYNAVNDGFYSFDSAIFFEYGGSAGGINYVVGVQESQASGSAGQPDLYAGMTTTVSGLNIAAVAMYDANGGDVGGDQNGAWAYTVRGDYDLSSFIPGGSIGMYWKADHGDTDYVKGHVWGATMQANLTDKLVAFAGYSQYDADDEDCTDVGGSSLQTYGLCGDARDWTVGVRWNVVSGLYVQGEWNKTQLMGDASDINRALGIPASRDQFTVRIHRSF